MEQSWSCLSGQSPAVLSGFFTGAVNYRRGKIGHSFYAKQNDFSRWFQRVFLILSSDRVVDHFKSNNFCLTSPLSHPVRFLFSNSTPLLGTSSLPFLRSASLSQNSEPWKQLCRECPLPPQLRALPHPQPPFPPQPQPHPRPLPLPPL